MEFLPLPIVPAIVFLFGVVFGSFANVLIYRLHTGRSLNDRSHCLSCGTGLAWYELLPLASYLALRGRCRTCGSYIPVRYALVEGMVGLAFVLSFIVATDLIVALLLCAFMFALIVGAVYDLAHFIIPDEVVAATGGIALVLMGYEAYLLGSFTPLMLSAIAAVSAFACFGGLWLVSGGRWIGFGDAKLVAPLAFMVGPWATFSLIVLAFWIGAAISVGLMLAQRFANGGQSRLQKGTRQLRMKSEIPFAPFLMIAFVLVFFFHADVLALTEYVLTTSF